MPDPAENIDPETGEILSPAQQAQMVLAGAKQQKSFSETRMALAGVRQLSKLTQAEFDERVTAMKLGKERMREVQRSLLDEGTDFGAIPGMKEKDGKKPKKTLFKSGAEKLAEFFQFATSYEVTRAIGDGLTAPTIHYTVKCFVHLGSEDGPVIHAGVGTANSWEVKYRYRNAGRTCPSCKQDTILKTKANDYHAAGYWCAPKNGGCGENFKLGNAEIESQTPGRKDNPDPYDMDNTFVKMAKKRAFVDAIIGATATSELFTQDIGDTGAGDHGDAPTGDPPAGFDDYGSDPAVTTAAPRGAPAAATKPPAPQAPAPASGDKRADAMIETFRKSATLAGLEKLGAVIANWPDNLKAIVKEPYTKRHAELSAAGK